jgi:hypothetical protein
MTEHRKPLPFSAYSTTIASTRAEAGQFRGLVGCAPVFDAAHPDYYEFLCEQLHHSRATAKRDAQALLLRLSEGASDREGGGYRSLG